MDGINFKSNIYGITRKEWKAFKKELKAADKANDNFDLSRTDYKDMKVAIKNGDLGAYLDKASDDLKLAMGLSLTGKVDGTEYLTQASNIAKVTDIKNADKAKVIEYIQKANYNKTENYMANFFDTVFDKAAGIKSPAMKRAIATHMQKQDGPFADLFCA